MTGVEGAADSRAYARAEVGDELGEVGEADEAEGAKSGGRGSRSE